MTEGIRVGRANPFVVTDTVGHRRQSTIPVLEAVELRRMKPADNHDVSAVENLTLATRGELSQVLGNLPNRLGIDDVLKAFLQKDPNLFDKMRGLKQGQGIEGGVIIFQATLQNNNGSTFQDIPEHQKGLISYLEKQASIHKAHNKLFDEADFRRQAIATYRMLACLWPTLNRAPR